MLEDIWNWFLEVTALLVTPDWNALVALIPIAIIVLVVVWLIWIVRRFRSAPPPRRGKTRLVRRTPAGIHMPGPSWAPFFAAVGTALLLWGLVYGGLMLWLGVLALVLTLLYWLAEGIRIYDHDAGSTVPALSADTHTGPPPGVHMPGPSFRPILGALGVSMLMAGLVFGGWLLLAGVLALIATLVGWLFDAGREYGSTVEADRTGHLEAQPAPRTPSLMLSVLGVIFVAGILLQTGLLPPGSASGGVPSASGSPAPSGSAPPSGAPPSSGGPPPSAVTGDVTLTAQGIAFVETTITGPADKPFTIAFVNNDPGTPHDVAFKDANGGYAWRGEPISGVATKLYDVPALPAGSYTFVCTIHSNMTGTATLK
jgi:plastocyanin